MTPSSIKSERRRIKWPAANMTSLWNQFDIDVDQILEATMRGEVDRKLKAMTMIIVSIAPERFGEEVKGGSFRGPHSKNQQWHRRRRRERARKRAAFIANPFKFTKDLLGQKRSGQLACSQEEIEHHLKETYSDPLREQELGECSTLINPPGPSVQFNMAELQLNEVRVVARKARASSAPRPSGTSYKVYKNCPKLLLRLWKILRVIWRRGRTRNSGELLKGSGFQRRRNPGR
ncbi:hypothetical protein DPEC_G00070580 [Dallia pectoralis]|uniref:Uncharacterized protein n=1 Tax=Dallia pectoralis TaxID=75939 RepID=A0ACC2H2U7_DALPE|nr:hypothetical protein DPEC_G00070580 [Dallia pectoralis]